MGFGRILAESPSRVCKTMWRILPICEWTIAWIKYLSKHKNTTMFTSSDVKTPINQWECAYYNKYFIVIDLIWVIDVIDYHVWKEGSILCKLRDCILLDLLFCWANKVKITSCRNVSEFHLSFTLRVFFCFSREELSYIFHSFCFTIDRDDLKVKVALMKPIGISCSNAG